MDKGVNAFNNAEVKNKHNLDENQQEEEKEYENSSIENTQEVMLKKVNEYDKNDAGIFFGQHQIVFPDTMLSEFTSLDIQSPKCDFIITTNLTHQKPVINPVQSHHTNQ